jgi:hypothetical protein
MQGTTLSLRRKLSVLYFIINGSAALPLGLGRFFRFLILYRIGRTPWTGDQPVSHRTTQTQNKLTHPCLVESNPGRQCSSKRRQVRPQTARPLCSAFGRSRSSKSGEDINFGWPHPERTPEILYVLRCIRVDLGLPYGRQSVDQFILVSGSPLGSMTRFYPYPFFTDNCFVVLPLGRPLWRDDGSVTYSAIADWSGHWGPISINYRLIWDCVPSSSPLTTRRDYGEGILTRLCTGVTELHSGYELRRNYVNCMTLQSVIKENRMEKGFRGSWWGVLKWRPHYHEILLRLG